MTLLPMPMNLSNCGFYLCVCFLGNFASFIVCVFCPYQCMISTTRVCVIDSLLLAIKVWRAGKYRLRSDFLNISLRLLQFLIT